MKRITKAWYSWMIGFLIITTICFFTMNLKNYNSFIFHIIIIIAFIIMLVIYYYVWEIKKYKNEAVIDERSTILAYKSGYYSWVISMFVICFIFLINLILNLDTQNVLFIFLITLLASFGFLHMYFNFTNKLK